MTQLRLLLTASLTLLAMPAFADGANCPLHARLEAQKQVQTANLAPSVIPISVTPPSTPPLPTPSARNLSPQSVDKVERGVDTLPIVKMAKTDKSEAMAIVDSSPSPHAGWTEILQTYVSAPDGQGLTHFDYGGLKTNAADKAKLDGYIESLEATDSNTLSENEAIAFYANLYNAVTVQHVTEKFPVKSIRKLGAFSSGPWKKKLFTLNGNPTSLDTLEHDILRKQYPSPYVHYMVNCASVGCPNLLNEAWEASTLDAKRKEAAADYINSPRGVVVDGDDLTVSSIFKWFEEDFGDSKAGVLEHIRKHADADLAAAIDGGAKIDDYDYDWSLNK